MFAINIHTVSLVISEVAATAIMPLYRNLKPGDVEAKAADDYVTRADKDAESALTRRLADLYPGSVVLGEEAFAKDKTLLRLLDGDAPVWVIDPIDGTSLFKEGLPGFGVMVALIHRGTRIAGWIHDPVANDTIMGEKGSGVSLSDGTRLKLVYGADSRGSQMPALIGWKIKDWLKDFPELVFGGDLPFRFSPGRCSSIAYPQLFSGNRLFANSSLDRAGIFFLRMTHIWDHAPGIFLVEEAGGMAMTWRGEAYDGKDALGGLIVAPSRAIAEDFSRFAQPIIRKHFSDVIS